MTEKELKKLFRQKLEHRDFAYNPQSWRAMERMLDQKKTSAPFYRRSIAAILGFAAAVILALYLPANEVKPALIPTAQLPDKAIFSSTELLISSEREPMPILTTPGPSSKLSEQASQGGQALIANEAIPADDLPDGIFPENAQSAASSTQTGIPIQLKILRVDPGERRPTLLGLSHFTESLSETSAKTAFEPSPPHLMLTASAGGHQGSNTSSGMVYRLGLSYEQPLSANWQITGGIQYIHQQNLGIKTGHDSIFFSFGREIVQVDQQYLSINLLQFPVAIQYQWGKHAVQTGAFAQATLQTKVQSRREVFSFKGRDEVREETTTETLPEINRWQYGVNAAYRYRLNKQWHVQADWSLDLTDLTNNQAAQMEANHRYSRWMLGIAYQLY